MLFYCYTYPLSSLLTAVYFTKQSGVPFPVTRRHYLQGKTPNFLCAGRLTLLNNKNQDV